MCFDGLSVEFKDFHIADAALVQTEAKGCPDHMKTLNTGGSGIYDHHISLRIPHHFKDMGMAADKDVWMQFVDQFPGAGIISAWIATYMSHQHFHSLAFKEAMEGMGEAEVVVVTVASDTYERLELGDRGGKIEASTEVAGVPDLVHRGEEFTKFGAEDAVGVGY